MLFQFNLLPAILGLVFVVQGLSYALAAPVWGYVCDKVVRPKICILIGCGLVIVGFLLIGPVPFIPLDTCVCKYHHHYV